MINIQWTKYEQKSIVSFFFRGITLRKYLNLAGIHVKSNLPLFGPLVFHRGTSSYTLRDGKISHTSCREILRNSLKQVGFNPDDHGLYSLRSGGITSVIRNSCNSVSERLLKIHGR